LDANDSKSSSSRRGTLTTFPTWRAAPQHVLRLCRKSECGDFARIYSIAQKWDFLGALGHKQ
jgi:hypothetical protein